VSLTLRFADPRDVYRIVDGLLTAAEVEQPTRAPLAARYRAISEAIGDGVDRSDVGPEILVPQGDCVCGAPEVVIEAPAHHGTWLLTVDPDGTVHLDRVEGDLGDATHRRPRQ